MAKKPGGGKFVARRRPFPRRSDFRAGSYGRDHIVEELRALGHAAKREGLDPHALVHEFVETRERRVGEEDRRGMPVLYGSSNIPDEILEAIVNDDWNVVGRFLRKERDREHKNRRKKVPGEDIYTPHIREKNDFLRNIGLRLPENAELAAKELGRRRNAGRKDKRTK